MKYCQGAPAMQPLYSKVLLQGHLVKPCAASKQAVPVQAQSAKPVQSVAGASAASIADHPLLFLLQLCWQKFANRYHFRKFHFGCLTHIAHCCTVVFSFFFPPPSFVSFFVLLSKEFSTMPLSYMYLFLDTVIATCLSWKKEV